MCQKSWISNTSLFLVISHYAFNPGTLSTILSVYSFAKVHPQTPAQEWNYVTILLMLVSYICFPPYSSWEFVSINSLYSFFSKILPSKKRVQTHTRTLTSATSQKLLEPKSTVFNYRAKYLTFRLAGRTGRRGLSQRKFTSDLLM